MKNLNKVKSYYGLSVRARKVALGTNEILEKDVFAVVASKALSQNALNKISNHIEKRNSMILSYHAVPTEEEMFFITENSKILVFGLTDKGLANAMIQNIA